MDDVFKQMTLEFFGTGKHKISAEKFLEEKDFVFLDVRTYEEIKVLAFNFELFGIQTFKIPINELPQRYNELPKEKTIACFCSSGTRSAWAYTYLLSKGIKAKWLSASNEDLAMLLKPGKIFNAINNK